MSLGFIVVNGLVKFLICPCWVVVYMRREYIAVKNLTRPNKGTKYRDFDRVAVINVISLRRLIDGGAAIFAAVKRNHHIVITGLIVIRPLVRNMLRVWVIS